MADATLFNYVAAATGIYGAVMGHIAFRRSVKTKTLDMRLQLRTDLTALRPVVDALPALLRSAHGSHVSVLNAHGLGTSGNMQTWREDFDRDMARVADLLVPDANADYADLSESQLETHIVQTRALAQEVTRLEAKYRASMALDETMRAELRENESRRWLASAGRLPPGL